MWVRGPIAARVCVDVHGLCYHQRPQGWPGSGPEAALMSESHSITRTILISVPWVTSGPGVLLRTMSGSTSAGTVRELAPYGKA